MEALFIYHEDFSIQTVKSRTVFEPSIWSKTFGKSLKQNIIEAKIIHTHLGLTLPLKTFSRTPISQTVEFAGLHGYSNKSEMLVVTFNDLESRLQHTRVTRMDIAIDYKGEIPKSIVKALCRTREPFRYGNTTYYKTAKEKKTNPFMDIKIYNKAHKANLDYPLMRLEFVFKAKYLKNALLKDMNQVIVKMENTIKKATGLSVKIESI